MGTPCCRLAGDPLLPAFDLGQLYVSDFVEPGTSKNVGRKLPLKLGLGPTSGLLQLMDSPTADSLYRHYHYRSGMNESMRHHLADVLEAALYWGSWQEGDTVCDIGCNDGTLCTFWKAYAEAARIIGFDPARNLDTTAKAEEEGWTFVNDYFSAGAFERVSGGRRAKIITSIAMFYDLDSPRQFCQQVDQVLHPEGLWICEMQYLPLVLQMNAFDAFCHEHCAVYGLSTFEQALRGTTLQIQRVALNTVNGGTMRFFITHRKREANERISASQRAIDQRQIHAVRVDEETIRMHQPRTYENFRARIERLRKDTRDLLCRLRDERKVVGGYGASTKGNTLLQFYELGPDLLPWIAERDETKWGKVTIDTEIPIISEAEMRARKPDYLFALPWHFASSFLKREEKLVSQGTRFIIPLPTVHLLPS